MRLRFLKEGAGENFLQKVLPRILFIASLYFALILLPKVRMAARKMRAV